MLTRIPSEMYHDALSQLLDKVHKLPMPLDCGPITLHSRFNGPSGMHVHASTRVSMRLDASVDESSMKAKAMRA